MKTRPRLAAGQASEILLSTATRRCGQIKVRGGRCKWEKRLYRRRLPSSVLKSWLSRYGGFILNDVVWQFYRNFAAERISQGPMARRLRLVSRHSRSLRMSDEEIPFLAPDTQVSPRPRQGWEGLKAWCFDRLYLQSRSNWKIPMGLAAVAATGILSWMMCVQLILMGQSQS